LLTANTSTASVSPNDPDVADRDMLFEYLSAEVFDELPNAIRWFLLRTSILREFTAGFCDNLIGSSNSQGLIDQIKDRGLFLEERTSEIATFAYHDLFRDYLVRRFKSDFPKEYEGTTRNAAALYRELGDDDAAIFHYLECGDAGEVVGIVKQFSGSYFDQGSWSKLASCLDRLPDHVVESDSELLLLYGRILTMKVGDPIRALEQFDKLLAGNHTENAEVVGKALVAKSTAYRRLGHLDLAVKVAQDGLAILLEVDCPQDHIAEAHRQLASALFTRGDQVSGKRHFQAALRLVRADNLSLLSLICDGLAGACIESGELDQAAVYLERARTGWLKLGSEGPLAESLINLSLVYHHMGEFDLAFDEAAQALQIAEAAAYPRLVATALVRQSSVQQALGAYEDSLVSASHALELARELLDQRLIGESTHSIGYAYWKTGQTSKALVLLNQALIEADQSGQKHPAAIYNIFLGKVYCQDRSYDQALNHLSVAQELLADMNNPRRVSEIGLFQAAIFYRMGHLKEALEQLNEVARLISELGYDGFLDGSDVLDVLRFGAARRVGGDTFTRLVARLTATPLPAEGADGILSEADGPSLLPALHAMGFGSPRVLLDAHTVGDVEWRSRKAKELFFFLLCHKRSVGNEELVEALWPDSSVSLSNSALKTNIYRLRQAVFYDSILVEERGYRINPAATIQFDVDDFENHLRLATQATDGTREEHLQIAVEIYDGPFLNGYYSEWCERSRTDLELKFHTALMTLAEYHSARGEFLISVDLLAKVVESDPYNEEAQYRLVENYIEANQPLTALQNLRTYAEVCREELGIQLPQRFVHIHQSILNHLHPRTDVAR